MEVKEINDIHIYVYIYICIYMYTHTHIYIYITYVSCMFQTHDFPLKQLKFYSEVNNNLYVICGPGYLGRHSDSLRPGRSENRIPMSARFSTLLQTGHGAHSASPEMGTESLYRDKVAGACL
jgi:hypothetical protein